MKGRILATLAAMVLVALILAPAVGAFAGGGSGIPGAPAAAPKQQMRTPHYRSCVPAEPALAAVASLHRVSFRTACRLTKRLATHKWPESDMTHEGKWCFNWLGKVHEFEGWNVKVPKLDHGPATLSRHGRWFAFLGQEFPIGCV